MDIENINPVIGLSIAAVLWIIFLVQLRHNRRKAR